MPSPGSSQLSVILVGPPLPLPEPCWVATSPEIVGGRTWSMAIGAAGPTSSYRMDAYSPRLMVEGLKGMIGKGMRSKEVKEAMKREKAVYLGAIGGAGALIAGCIRKVEVVAYDDLGPEALRRIEVRDFPVTVVNDIYGGDIYEAGRSRFRVTAPKNVAV